MVDLPRWSQFFYKQENWVVKEKAAYQRRKVWTETFNFKRKATMWLLEEDNFTTDSVSSEILSAQFKETTSVYEVSSADPSTLEEGNWIQLLLGDILSAMYFVICFQKRVKKCCDGSVMSSQHCYGSVWISKIRNNFKCPIFKDLYVYVFRGSSWRSKCSSNFLHVVHHYTCDCNEHPSFYRHTTDERFVRGNQDHYDIFGNNRHFTWNSVCHKALLFHHYWKLLLRWGLHL